MGPARAGGLLAGAMMKRDAPGEAKVIYAKEDLSIHTSSVRPPGLHPFAWGQNLVAARAHSDLVMLHEPVVIVVVVVVVVVGLRFHRRS